MSRRPRPGPLRVGLVCHASCGGSTRVTVSLALALVARGHAVDLFTLAPPMLMGDPPEGLVLHALRDSCVGPADRLHTTWTPDDLEELPERISLVAHTSGLDILHVHYGVPFAGVALAVRRRLGAASPRLVGTLHGTDVSIFGLDPTIGPELATALNQFDAVTTVSANHAALATAMLGLDHRPEVIPNFVDLLRWAPQELVTPDPGRPRILHISNFRPVKNPQAVARIFADVRARHDAELWLVGEGEEMPRVRAVVDDAGLASDVTFFGLRRDVEKILPTADLLLMTSHAESFCLTLLEAMACGVPVVAPKVGGIPEVVEHGRSGLLFEPGNDTDAAAAVGLILGDRRLGRELAAEGRRRAQGFASDVIVPRYEALYRRVIARPARLAHSDGRDLV